MRPAFRLVLTLVLLTAAVRPIAQSAPSDDKAAPSLMSELPPNDSAFGWWLQKGLSSKRADRLLRGDPLGVETVRELVAAQRTDEAFAAAVQIFEKRPERMARALVMVGRVVPEPDAPPERSERAREMLTKARTRLQALEKPERAEAASALMNAESLLLRGNAPLRNSYQDRLRAFIQEYAGTDAALEAEVSLIVASDSGRDSAKKIDELLAFSRAHPATAAGAKALYSAGLALTDAARGTAGSDPTDKFLRLFEIVAELESGRFPKCEWTDKASEIVIGFFVLKPTYSKENADKLLAACTSFVARHWKLDDQANPADYGIGYFVTSRIADLYKVRGDGVDGMEQFFADLENAVPDRPAAQYMRAMFYLKPSDPNQPGARPPLLEKATQLLASIHQQGGGLYKRKALATLASLAFYYRDYPAARDAFAKYVREFPDSPYAWVAALRAGQCHERMNDWASALAAYQAVPVAGDWAPARVLADVFAGHAYEALGEPAKALAMFRRAVLQWDPAFGYTHDLYLSQASRPGAPMLPEPDPDTRVTRANLQERIEQLERTTASPGAVPLEQARWFLKMKRWQEAAASAEQVSARTPKSSNVPEARYIGHRAQLEQALEKADVERPGSDPAAALAILDRLSREPFDFAVCVADIARAYLRSGTDSAGAGERLMLEALGRFKSGQRPKSELTALEQDAASIRSLVFRPNGDGIFSGSRWNGFSWPRQPAPFVIVGREVGVTLAGGTLTRLAFVQPFSHLDNALFLDVEQIALLNTLITRLGGTRSRPGQIFVEKGYMEAPNQPVGPSLTVMAFLNKAFRVMPGHWGGWHFETFPSFGIQFTDDARTKAVARVRVGYGGGNVLLEKQGGVWTATRLNQTWVE